MNESINRAQATIGAMKLMVEALEDLGQHLPKNPKLYAILAESPLEDLRRRRDELEQHLEQLKRDGAPTASPRSIIDNTISTPAAPGRLESTS